MKLYGAILAAAILLSSLFAVSTVMAPPPPITVYVSPTTATAGGPGEPVIVSLMIDGVPPETPIYAYGLKMTWHGPLLECVSVSEGEFLQMGGSTYFTPHVDNTDLNSYIDVGCTLIGAVPGVTGSGMLFMVEFLVEGTGECPLDITTVLITPNPAPPPDLLEVDHSDDDGYFETTMMYWKASLVKKSAWPQYHHFDMSAKAPNEINLLFAKVRNLGMMDVWVRVYFSIRGIDGVPISLTTDDYLLTVAEDVHDFYVGFDTAEYGAGKYYVEAKVKYDTNGNGYIDTWSPKIKTFSFTVVP